MIETPEENFKRKLRARYGLELLPGEYEAIIATVERGLAERVTLGGIWAVKLLSVACFPIVLIRRANGTYVPLPSNYYFRTNDGHWHATDALPAQYREEAQDVAPQSNGLCLAAQEALSELL